ncbi:hypothetical protein [Phenylobacterium montanum]|uniref:Uncharacterized protein n=1 Tax=Phenylobacterium montanum TaxID=2823693 RepID=A0A975IWQ3_9CAUL|nr:hypothetical protein [Caulobacter sp. S6]QUD90317.1 hypothetical protein KCG34_10850 [Caulobacter sp. S6]
MQNIPAMGAKNLDRIPLAEWRRTVETVWDMQQAGWEVISRCRTCGLTMLVDLDLVGWTLGPRTSLWNKHPQCRRLGCQGVVDFQAKVPRRGIFEVLAAEWPPGKDPMPTGTATITVAEIIIGPGRIGAECRPCAWKRVLSPAETITTFGLGATLDQVQAGLRRKCPNPECRATVRVGKARRGR